MGNFGLFWAKLIDYGPFFIWSAEAENRCCLEKCIFHFWRIN